MSFDQKKDISKPGTVELSDDALEGVSGGVYFTPNGMPFDLGGVSSSPSTPKVSGSVLTGTPNVQTSPKLSGDLTLGSTSPKGIYVKDYNTCSFYKSKRLSSSDPRICECCRYYNSVPADGGGYCMRSCS